MRAPDGFQTIRSSSPPFFLELFGFHSIVEATLAFYWSFCTPSAFISDLVKNPSLASSFLVALRTKSLNPSPRAVHTVLSVSKSESTILNPTCFFISHHSKTFKALVQHNLVVTKMLLKNDIMRNKYFSDNEKMGKSNENKKRFRNKIKDFDKRLDNDFDSLFFLLSENHLSKEMRNKIYSILANNLYLLNQQHEFREIINDVVAKAGKGYKTLQKKLVKVEKEWNNYQSKYGSSIASFKNSKKTMKFINILQDPRKRNWLDMINKVHVRSSSKKGSPYHKLTTKDLSHCFEMDVRYIARVCNKMSDVGLLRKETIPGTEGKIKRYRLSNRTKLILRKF